MLQSPDIRLVLTWGPHPSDLDSMIRFFDENGNEVCKLYYPNKKCEDYATLDVDETNVSYFAMKWFKSNYFFLFLLQGGTNGPETISIKGENIPDGVTAMYYIKDYSNVIGQGSMSFKQSDAKVLFKLSYFQFWGTLNEKWVEQIFSKVHGSVHFLTNQDDSF